LVLVIALAILVTDSAEPRGPYLASGMPSVISERTSASYEQPSDRLARAKLVA
jgi:hypothetical protein